MRIQHLRLDTPGFLYRDNEILINKKFTLPVKG